MDLKFSIAFRESKNRCAISNRHYERGEVMLIEEPYVMVVDEKHSNAICSYCGISFNNDSIYCIDANVSNRYCSTKCLTYDYPIHKNEISILTDFGHVKPESGNNPFHLAIRIFSGQINDNSNISQKESTQDISSVTLGRLNTYSQIYALESKVKIIYDDALQLCNSLMNIFEASAVTINKPANISEIATMLSIIQTNAHYIVNDNNHPIALGLFPMTSMLNHSCQPNCVHDFIFEQGKPPKLVMIAIEDINEGDELCYSYIPLYQSTEKRREQLLSAYDFLCNCCRCSQQLSSRISLTDNIDISLHSSNNVATQSKSSFEAAVTVDSEILDDRCIDNIIVLPPPENETSVFSFLGITDRLISRTEDCEQLLSLTYDNTEETFEDFDDAFRSLLSLLSSSHFISPKDICHIDLVRAYSTLSKMAMYLLNYTSLTCESKVALDCSDKELYCKCALGFSSLALGCIYQFTNNHLQQECAHLEYIRVFAIKEIILNEWNESTFHSLPSLNINLCSKEYVIQQFTDFIILCLDTNFAKLSDKKIPLIIRMSMSNVEKCVNEKECPLIVTFATACMSTLKLYRLSSENSSKKIVELENLITLFSSSS